MQILVIPLLLYNIFLSPSYLHSIVYAFYSSAHIHPSPPLLTIILLCVFVRLPLFCFIYWLVLFFRFHICDIIQYYYSLSDISLQHNAHQVHPCCCKLQNCIIFYAWLVGVNSRNIYIFYIYMLWKLGWTYLFKLVILPFSVIHPVVKLLGHMTFPFSVLL